jgi:endoglucanase
LEGSVCDDLPQEPDEDRSPVMRLGGGAAITIADKSMISHPGLLRLLTETASEECIPVQFVARGHGGTDSGAVALGRAGVPAMTVSIPSRYIHSPAAILNLNDLRATVDLMSAALRRLNAGHLARA